MLLSTGPARPTPTQFRALTRIDDETRARHVDADTQRLALMVEPCTASRYRRFLLRVYGFEAPVETALQRTPGLSEVFDMRARFHTRLLKSDLAALRVVDLSRAPRCESIPRFTDALEALGWIYVIERGRMLSSILQRHLEQTMPALALTSAAYLRAERSAGKRMRELGAAFDAVVSCETDVDRVVVAAHGAFRAQSHWYSEAWPTVRQP
jgi:heme oxygenase